MKRAAISLALMLCLSMTSFLVRHGMTASVNTNIIYVPGDYLTIQEAINNADDGDVVYVRNGTYFGPVLVDRPVSLIGESQESTIIDGAGTAYVVTLTASNVSIQNFTIMNSRKGTGGLWCGINVVSPSASNTISTNKIINNRFGIVLWASSNNEISGNIISSNEYNGMHLLHSLNNLITSNTISLNNNNGIYLNRGLNNLVYHNNFINNTRQVDSEDSADVWDDGYPSGGNYWSDYNGTDSFMGPLQNVNGSDGIGDTPYFIHQHVQDSYPLMGEFFHFSVTFKDEAYDFNVVSNSTISDFSFDVGAETGSKIIRFKASNLKGARGFCKVSIPTELMKYPYIVLVDNEDIEPALLSSPNEMQISLYFTYDPGDRMVTIISSEVLYLVQQLLDSYKAMQIDFEDLNTTYHVILDKFNALSVDYTELQESFCKLNHSYQEHMLSYGENVENLRSLMYIFAATTAIFLVTTVYLSKSAHGNKAKNE